MTSFENRCAAGTCDCTPHQLYHSNLGNDEPQCLECSTTKNVTQTVERRGFLFPLCQRCFERRLA